MSVTISAFVLTHICFLMLFVLIYIHYCSTQFQYHKRYSFSFHINTTGVISGAATDKPSGAVAFTPMFQWDSYCPIFSILCSIILSSIGCPFALFLLAIVLSVLPLFTASGYPFWYLQAFLIHVRRSSLYFKFNNLFCNACDFIDQLDSNCSKDDIVRVYRMGNKNG